MNMTASELTTSAKILFPSRVDVKPGEGGNTIYPMQA